MLNFLHHGLHWLLTLLDPYVIVLFMCYDVLSA